MTKNAPDLTRAELLAAMEAFPLHAQFGLQIVEAAEGRALARCTVGPAHLNYGGVVHGGVMYLLLDVVAYCAAVTLLPAGMNATTHDIHVSMLRPTPGGAELELRSVVRKQGRTIVFIDVEATVGEKLVASARVTKSLVALQ